MEPSTAMIDLLQSGRWCKIPDPRKSSMRDGECEKQWLSRNGYEFTWEIPGYLPISVYASRDHRDYWIVTSRFHADMTATCVVGSWPDLIELLSKLGSIITARRAGWLDFSVLAEANELLRFLPQDGE